MSVFSSVICHNFFKCLPSKLKIFHIKILMRSWKTLKSTYKTTHFTHNKFFRMINMRTEIVCVKYIWELVWHVMFLRHKKTIAKQRTSIVYNIPWNLRNPSVRGSVIYTYLLVLPVGMIKNSDNKKKINVANFRHSNRSLWTFHPNHKNPFLG